MAAQGQSYLLTDRRFYPMLITQACGCFNDNLLKNAVIMMITFKATFQSDISSTLLISIANASFTLPFLLLASIAGQVADKFEKSLVVKVIKAFELFIVALSIYGFMNENLGVLVGCIVLMGIHSAFFGPIKYSIIPEHLRKDELIAANGYIESTTFLTILIGTLLGSLAVSGVYAVLFLIAGTAILGFYASLQLLPSTNVSPEIKINYNIFSEIASIVKNAASKKLVFLSILGISWFWFLGVVFITQIPTLTKEVFYSNEYVANIFLATFSIGVCVGSFLCSKIFGNEIKTKYVFLSLILISVFGIDLFFASRIATVKEQFGPLHSSYEFLTRFSNWRVLFDLFAIANLAGLYIVPLFAVMQAFSSPSYRSRVIAANNVINAVFMLASTIFISVMHTAGLTVPSIIFIACVMNIFIAFFIYEMIPENEIVPYPLLKRIFKFILDKLYKVEVKGLENFHKAGKRAVIVSNHISYLDPPLLATYLPEKITFAINTFVAQVSWIKPFASLVPTYPVDPNNPMAMKNLINEVKKNKKIIIFPEGRLSTTGSLMKIYEGPGMIAHKADANILPIRVDGPQFTMFSKLSNIFKNRLFPKVTITILPPVKIEAPQDLSPRDTRKYLSQKLYDIMSEMMFESSDYKNTIFQSLLNAAQTYGYKHPIIMDNDNSNIDYRNLITRSFILGDIISKQTKIYEHVGLMLPNSCAAVMGFYGMQAYNRIPTMINFSSGSANVISACKTACIKTIFTSRRFIDKAELHNLVKDISDVVEVKYLEDLRANLSIFTKLKGVIAGYVPNFYYNFITKDKDYNNTSVILFTSGTEGVPKAVALSHLNLQSNRSQMSARVDFGVKDLAFNALPLFHCFGLMAGCLLTTLSGVRTFYYPSPLHYRIIPEVIYDTGATIMFGTDTFLNGYAKFADPYDFYSIRYTFAGAEKLKPETRMEWFNKFGVRIFEGYGVTEASPVVAVNTPMHDKPGTVGRLAPKIESSLLKVEGIEEGGRLCIKGPNIMKGYIYPDNPGIIVPPKVEKLGDGWYDTGDIVTIDDDGYVKIQGRAKRFAKIAGEMISLSLVEEIASQIDASETHAAIHMEDDKKGEKILLYSTSSKLNRESFSEKVKKLGYTELLTPKEIFEVNEVPVLPTGKINYRKLISDAEKGLENE